jgi:subtilisin family serine protease
VCWSQSAICYSADILAAIEQAISDGVDIISLSLGSSTITDSQGILKDMISIGAFHALARNILLVASAGNDGPTPGSVTNVAPWVFTVAASTIDRDFSSTMTIGNKTVTVSSLIFSYSSSSFFFFFFQLLLILLIYLLLL